MGSDFVEEMETRVGDADVGESDESGERELIAECDQSKVCLPPGTAAVAQVAREEGLK